MEIEWTGKDLHGQTTAEIPEDSIVPRSRAAQMANAQKMMEMGLITSLSDYAFFAELPDARHALEAAAPDVAWAREENGLFAAGHMTAVEEWDDDEAHITEHNRYRKTMDYRLLEDQQRQDVNTHVKAHETQAAAKLGKRQGQSQISPLLAGAPVASGAAPLDPAMMAGGGGAPPSAAPPAAGAAPATPADLSGAAGPTSDMLSALQAQHP